MLTVNTFFATWVLVAQVLQLPTLAHSTTVEASKIIDQLLFVARINLYAKSHLSITILSLALPHFFPPLAAIQPAVPIGSCVAAGFTECCTDSYGCNGQSVGTQTCSCDFNCHEVGDCCDDIDITCPNIPGEFMLKPGSLHRDQLQLGIFIVNRYIKLQHNFNKIS